jgi:hypothetical protein
MSVNYNPATPTDGLVLCLDTANRRSYPGSGTTWFDLSGKGNNGTLTNGPTLNTGFGGGISFDGTDDRATSTMFLQSSFPYSISAFFRTTKTSGIQRITTLHKANTNLGFFSLRISDGGAISANAYADTGNESFAVGSIISTNIWYHAVAVFASATDRKIYLNGKLEATDTTSIAIPATIDYAGFGSINWSTGHIQYFQGQLDDIRIYSRALSPSEIYQLFSSKRGRFNV